MFKHAIEKKELSTFSKKVSTQKIKKNSNVSVSRTTLVYPGLRTKIDLRLKKTKKCLGQFQKLCLQLKNSSHTFSIFGNCMISIFFAKTKTSVFSSPYCFIRIKQPQNLVYIFFQPFSKLYKNCMTKMFPFT